MARVWLDVYADEQDAEAVVRLLERGKANQAGDDNPIPSLDWGRTWENADDETGVPPGGPDAQPTVHAESRELLRNAEPLGDGYTKVLTKDAEALQDATAHEETRARQTGATIGQLQTEQRIAELRERINQLGEELYQLVAPTKGELLALEADVQVNPHIYVSYLIGDGDGDHTWIAFNVLEEREARAAMEDEPSA